MTLVRICGVGDVPEGEVRRFELDHRPFAVTNLGDEGFRVVDAIARAHYFLDEGEVDVDDETIEVSRSTARRSTSTRAGHGRSRPRSRSRFSRRKWRTTT